MTMKPFRSLIVGAIATVAIALGARPANAGFANFTAGVASLRAHPPVTTQPNSNIAWILVPQAHLPAGYGQMPTFIRLAPNGGYMIFRPNRSPVLMLPTR